MRDKCLSQPFAARDLAVRRRTMPGAEVNCRMRTTTTLLAITLVLLSTAGVALAATVRGSAGNISQLIQAGF